MEGMLLIGLLVGSVVFLGPAQAILAFIYAAWIYGSWFHKEED